MATKESNKEELNDSSYTDIPITPDKPSKDEQRRRRSQSSTSSSTTFSQQADAPRNSLLDDSAGTSSHRLNESVLQEAKEKIIQAEDDRRKSKLPKRLIPLVEMCLPPNYRLSQFEDDAEKTYQKVFGSCMSSACLGNVDDGTKYGVVDRKDNDDDGGLFEKAED